MLMFLLINSVSLGVASVFAVSYYSIELEGFCWNKFPLRVFVNMNQWSMPDYALAVREAVDSWTMSVQAYSDSINSNSLRTISYVFYVGGNNATGSYDIFISFTANEISPNTVGLTTNKWNPTTHEPIPPITINITTYSGAASRLFVKNVAMHEFGHALGLGHASSKNTLNGPELMYFSAPTDCMAYPSTLDLYGLAALFKGSFSQSIQLPTAVPYEMMQPTANNLPNTTPSTAEPDLDTIELILRDLSLIIQYIWENDRTNLIMLAVFLVILILVSTLDKNAEHMVSVRDDYVYNEQLAMSSMHAYIN